MTSSHPSHTHIHTRGGRYIDEEAFDIFAIYRESMPETALYFYLFPGADIVADLEPLMKAHTHTHRHTHTGRLADLEPLMKARMHARKPAHTHARTRARTHPPPPTHTHTQAKGFTIENGKLVNISMGQGQEKVAVQALDRCMKEGG